MGEEHTDRRSALKKLAVGGAVAWTAPMVLSSTASAQQGGSPPPSTTTTTSVPPVCIGNGDWVCGDPIVECGTQGFRGVCICEVDVEGNDVCWGNILCSDPRVVTCSSNADCLPGWYCTTNCCGTTCLPPCDGSFENPGTGGQLANGPTAAGV